MNPMSKAQTTRETLLTAGRRLFWARGYSNVSVREVAKAAQVDVALISRYFGSKLGLFEATLDGIDEVQADAFASADAFVDFIVEVFVIHPRPALEPSAMTMIMTNAGDSEVGDKVRASYQAKWQDPIVQIVGDPGRAALLSAAIFGMSVAEKTMALDGIADPQSQEYEAQFRKLLSGALT